MPLTDLKIRNAKTTEKPYSLPDINGLYLDVRPTGKKIWRVRVWIDNKEVRHTIGNYPDLTLQQARIAAAEAKQNARQGINPNEQKRTAQAAKRESDKNTFHAIALEWFERGKAKRSAGYNRQILETLQNNVFPLLGKRNIKSITTADVLAVIRKMEERGAHAVAINAKLFISAVYRYAIITQRAEVDPAAPLRGIIERKPVQHARALSKEEIADYLRRLKGFAGYRSTGIALELILLLWTRTVELRKATWDEFDLPNARWSIPAERMKMRRPHLVPLSRQALVLLNELHTISGSGKFLFPSTRRPSEEPVHATTHNMALRFLGYKWGEFSMHDFRATASTHLNEMGYNTDWIERQLAHVEQNQSRRPYNHAEYLPDRTRMMQEWADWIDTLR